MKILIRCTVALLLCLCLLPSLCPEAAAEEAEAQVLDVTASGTGYTSFSFLFDKNIKTYKKSSGNASIKLESTTGMASLYLLFDLEYGEYTVTDNDTGKSFTAGKYGFLHEYIDLKAAFGTSPTSVTIDFANGAVGLSEIYAFSEGQTPDFVQKWEAPLDGGADILLLSAHGDDEQLFFAGLLPYYAGQLNCRVQVAYMTDHRNLNNVRTHEMLNGLWAVGVEAYPVFGNFDDFLIESLEGTYKQYSTLGTTKDELLEFVVEQLRRFRPQVVVGHDINGEYKHGMHMVYTDLLIQALDISNNAESYPDSAEKYGTWDVPKTYIHLYETNPIELDYDTPLDHFSGLTAFQATQKLGYPCHESQQYTWFTRWINGRNNEITKATQITTYSPCKFGLYRSTVGEDVSKNDFLENITTYAEQERLEQERLEQERLEQERLEQERLEQERLEQERLEQERLEQERLEALRQELARQEAARQERLRRETQKKLIIALVLLVFLITLALVLIYRIRTNNRRKHSVRR
ncbi:MAG: PIG-L family deacetylase [Oscillospiraceae bacterium]|nr:PIG-L family deacetylase [Oscillospiraceae bacterium]